MFDTYVSCLICCAVCLESLWSSENCNSHCHCGRGGREDTARPSFTSLSQIRVCKAMLAASFACVVSETSTVVEFGELR
ncbi:hypothetical protein EJ02DRAFT_459387 [Clathrospora elynae]|uniref:Secreted protein n=1 Tax=Clathrospora elynae TaxID=706981 RepID=A0A6A5S9B9_9PLEO|nr:hypothetical protein EJ02DRAFT_459387 [Clathrospora elynae]